MEGTQMKKISTQIRLEGTSGATATTPQVPLKHLLELALYW
jgi:hypothetical protein